MRGKKLSQEEFISRAKLIFPEYNFDKVKYINMSTKILVECPKHGLFEAIPYNMIHGRHSGCPKCSAESTSKKLSKGIKKFKEAAIKVFPNYNYDKVEYINQYKKVKIICDHGHTFEVRPKDLLNGHGCPICAKNKTKIQNLQRFIELSKIAHGTKFDYTTLKFDGYQKPMIITCPIHGEVSILPYNHLIGPGCPKCGQSIGELKIENLLKNLHIDYKKEFPIEYSGNKTNKTYIDFYLPDKNMFIEYNGLQHYIPVKYFGGKIQFEKQKARDKYVEKYCNNNDIRLVVIKYNDNVEQILKDIL